jgi:serine/threonine protein kinase
MAHHDGYVKPIRIDLQMVESQSGGGVGLNNFINHIENQEYKYAENMEKSFNIEFRDGPKHFYERSAKTSYLGKGTYTLVCDISFQDKTTMTTPDTNCVIRIFRITKLHETNEIESHELNLFINKHELDYKLLPTNIIEIKYYGLLTTPSNIVLSYCIVKKYHTDISLVLNNDRYKILASLVNALKTLEEHDYIHADLKSDNIGFDDSYNCIFIDYDVETIMKIRGTYVELKYEWNSTLTYINDTRIASTFLPIYIKNFFHNNIQIIPAKYIKKIHIGGLCEIIFRYLKINNILNKIFSLMYHAYNMIFFIYDYNNLIKLFLPQHGEQSIFFNLFIFNKNQVYKKILEEDIEKILSIDLIPTYVDISYNIDTSIYGFLVIIITKFRHMIFY